MRQKCVKMGLVLLGKEERSKMRQKCVTHASEMRPKCTEHLRGRTPLRLLDDTETPGKEWDGKTLKTRRRGGVQKSMGHKVPWKTGMLICHPVTSRPLISPQKKKAALAQESPRQTKPKKGQKEKFMNFAHFCVNSGVFPWENKRDSHLELLLQNAPGGKVHEIGLSFLWFAGGHP